MGFLILFCTKTIITNTMDNLPLAGAWFRVEYNHEDWRGGVFVRERKWTPWKQVAPQFPIAKKTLSQLGQVWTQDTEWSREDPRKQR